jgi:ribose transport system substrate-binding protein
MRSILFGGFIVLALANAGCTQHEEPAPGAAPNLPATSSSGTKLTQAQLDQIGKPAKRYRLALVVKTRNNPFFTPMIQAAEADAAALGVDLDVQAPAQETDKERQFAIVQDLTARGVEAILIAPADSKGIAPALKQAADKRILVVNLDNRVDPATASTTGLQLGGYVGADNEEGGRLAGKAMAEALGGRGQVAVLEGIRGADNAEARKRGFTAAAAAAGLQIVDSQSADWDTQKAYAKFQSMLAAHPDLDGLFCANDKMALGAIKAIQEARKKGRITVIGYDNIPDVQPYLQSGELYATVEQHPDLMGKYGVRMAAGVLEGKLPRAQEFLVPLEVIRGAAPAPARPGGSR